MSENAKTFYVSKEGDESIPQYNFSVDVVEQTVDLRNFTIESTNPLGDDEMDEVIEALSQVDITTEGSSMHYRNDKGNDIFVIFRGTEYGDDAQISIENFINFEDTNEVEILDKYHVDDFDDVLIRIVQTIAEQRELRKEEQDDSL